MTIESELFLLIDKEKFQDAYVFMQENSARLNINALNQEGRSFLTSTLKMYQNTNECHAVIEQILSNPKFEHANRPEGKVNASPFKAVMSHGGIDLVELFLKYKDSQNIQMVFEKEQLWYKIQSQRLQFTLDDLAKGSKSYTQEFVISEQKTLEILRELTVQHALKTDDPTILQRMVDAGANLNTPFANGTSLSTLLQNKQDTKVYAWMSQHNPSWQAIGAKAETRAEIIARMEKRDALMQTQMDSILALRNSLKTVELEHEERKRNIVMSKITESKNTVKSRFKFAGDSGLPSTDSLKSAPKK